MASRPQTLLKVVVIGDSGVGKTSLMDQYVRKKFSQEYMASIGGHYRAKEIQIEDRVVVLQIWDTPGKEMFQRLGVAYCSGYDCCVLVYDVNVRKSFENLGNWHQEFLHQASPSNPSSVPFVVLGNKVDINGGNSRTVSENHAKEWCASNGDIPFFEISAKEDYNVDAAFLCIARLALANHRDRNMDQNNIISSMPHSPEPDFLQPLLAFAAEDRNQIVRPIHQFPYNRDASASSSRGGCNLATIFAASFRRRKTGGGDDGAAGENDEVSSASSSHSTTEGSDSPPSF